MSRLPATFMGVAFAVLVLSPLGARAPAHAQAIEQYVYEEGRIYPVRTGLGITTQIELGTNEEVLDFSTGFSAGWDLTRRGNVFYLKPRDTDVDTNLLVRSANRSYIFELKVVATDWTALEQAKRAGVQYRITFAYPGGDSVQAPAMEEAEPGPQLSTVLDKDRHYHFAYDYSVNGSQSWLVPANVYDDGRFTYLRMNSLQAFPSGNFPAVFARERADGEDFLVNTTVERDTLVVHGTFPYLVIRHGPGAVGLRRNAQP